MTVTKEDQAAHKANLVGYLRQRADNKWVSGVTDQTLFKEAADQIEGKTADDPAAPKPIVTPGYNELTPEQQQGRAPLPDPAAQSPVKPKPAENQATPARHP